MTKQIINLGQTANDRTGDPLRTAFQKVNENFDELYALASADVQIPAQTNNGGKFLTTNGTTLSWSSISQDVGTANTGFVDNRIYNINGPILSNDDLVHGATARLSLPEYGDIVNPITLYNNYGNFSVLLGPNGTITNSWTFNSDGRLTLPATGTIENTETNQPGTGTIYTFATDYNGNTNGLSTALSVRLTGGSPANLIQEGYIITFANGTTKTVTSSIAALPDNWDLFWSGDLTISNGADVWPITVQSIDYTPDTTSKNLIFTPDGTTIWNFDSDGTLTDPVGVKYRVQGNTTINGGQSGIVYSANAWQTGFKLVIMVETRLDNNIDDVDHTQICEALIASNYNSDAEPLLSVYGLTYTSPTPLATFTVQKTGYTSSGSGTIEVIATNLQTQYNLQVRVQAMQFGSFYD